MNILWLASWYPEKNDPFNGDFIKRHAIALSQYNELTLIHLTVRDSGEKFEGVRKSFVRDGNLYEILAEYRRPIQPGIAGKIRSFLKYFSYFKQIIKEHIAKNGVPDIVHVHVPYRAGWVALWLKRKYKMPLIVTEHWAGYDKRNPDNYYSRGPYFRYFVKRVFKNADYLTPVSQDLADRLKTISRNTNCRVIPNSVEIDLFYPEQRESIVFRFVHNTSQDDSHKNTLGLLEVLGKLKEEEKNWDCTIFGIPSQTALKKLRELGLENQVSFTNLVPHERVAEIMRNASAFINFSNYENMPCSVLEALCCGLPVIATRVGGNPEIIDDRNGILVSCKDNEGLYKAMHSLLNEEIKFNKVEIASNAKEKFSSQRIGKEIFDFYTEILKH